MNKKLISKIWVAGAGLIATTAIFPGVANALQAGDAYMPGTPEGPTASCSVNSVHKGTDGKNYMLTAGHCANEDITGDSNTPAVMYDMDGNEIGRVVGHVDNIFDEREENSPSEDWTVVELNDDVEIEDGVNSRFGETLGFGDTFPASTTRPLNGRVGNAVEGEYVYRDGGTSGRTDGMVLSKNDAGETYVLTWGLPGDSGGVLHDGEGANLGITSRSLVYIPFTIYNDADKQVEAAEAQTGVDLGTETVTLEDRDPNMYGPVGQFWNDMLTLADESDTVDVNAATNVAYDNLEQVDNTLVDVNTATNGSVDNAIDQTNQAVTNFNDVTAQADQFATDVNTQVSNAVTDAQAWFDDTVGQFLP